MQAGYYDDMKRLDIACRLITLKLKKEIIGHILISACKDSKWARYTEHSRNILKLHIFKKRFAYFAYKS